MAKGLILPVPDVLSAVYLVPAALPSREARVRTTAALATRVTGPVGTAARRMLEVGAIKVASQPASVVPPLPTGLQRHLGVRAELAKAVDQAERFVMLSASWPPGWPPVHESVARACAGALAAEINAPLVDAFVPKVITSRYALATLPDADSQLRLADWVLVLQSPGELGLWMTTKGLGRFGLPELQVRNVPPQLGASWTSVLTGLASRLLDMWLDALRERRGSAFAEMAAVFEVSEADVASARQESPTGDGTAVVRLTLDPSSAEGADSFLTVQPPDDYPASAGEYLTEVCTALFGDRSQDVRYLASSDSMQLAVQSALKSLPQARERFLKEELPAGARLMVKHKIATAEGMEYPWAYVNSWKDPGTVLGHSASDTMRDRRVRAGRPAVIDADSIVDWAIWTDERGFIEGGLTNTVALAEGQADML